MPGHLDAALAYAARGVPVLPLYPVRGGSCACNRPDCKNIGKHPIPSLAPEGLKNATTDAETVVAWWTRWPDANIGARLGAGVAVVLDVDPRNGGDASLAELVRENGPLPPGPVTRTGSGGVHHWFKHPGGVAPIAHGFRDGLDFQGDNTYVLLPPSSHKSGQDYRWEVELGSVPLPMVPAWLFGMVIDRGPRAGPRFEANAEGRIPHGRHHDFIVQTAASFASRIAGITEPVLLRQVTGALRESLDDVDQHGQEIAQAVQSAIAKYGRPAPPSSSARTDAEGASPGPAPADGEDHRMASTGVPGTGPIPPTGARADTPIPEALFYLDEKSGEWKASFPAFVGWFRTSERFVVPVERGTFSSAGSFELLRYEGGYYNGMARAFVRGRVEDAHRGKGLASRDNFREEVVKGIAATSEFHRRRTDFNPPERLCLKNGILNTETGVIEAHSPDTVFTWKLPVAYDPDATCPRFEQFLAEVMPNEAKRRLLVDLMGYCLWRRNPFQLFFLMVGDGANGKTTFTRVLQALLGPDAVSALDLGAIGEDRFTRAELEGKLANICDDLPYDKPLRATGVIKVLTGEGSILVQRKYQAPFQLQFGGKLVSNANRTPETLDDTFAFWRRAAVFDFLETFAPGDPRCDPLLYDKLVAELPGILNLALGGLRRVRTRLEFDPDHVLANAEEEWRKRADPIRSELLDDFEVAQGEFVTNRRIQDWHAARSQEAGRDPLSDDQLGKRITRAFPLSRSERKTVDGKMVWGRPNLREKEPSRGGGTPDIDLVLRKPQRTLPEAETPEKQDSPRLAVSTDSDPPATSRGTPGSGSFYKIGETTESGEQRNTPVTPASSPPPEPSEGETFSDSSPSSDKPTVGAVSGAQTDAAYAYLLDVLGRVGDLSFLPERIEAEVARRHGNPAAASAMGRLHGAGHAVKRDGLWFFRPEGPQPS